MKEAPIFVNSLFRSGSTYIYNVFQRADEPSYYCFQEPLHEVIWESRDAPDKLDVAGKSDTQKSLRHPEMDRGYFESMLETQSAWAAVESKPFEYDRAFDIEDIEKEVIFFEALIDASKARPVFQECRLSWRAGALKDKIKGTYIHLWRNPRDQWWSYKATPYFSSITQLIAAAPKRSNLVQWAMDAGGLVPIPEGPFNERLALATSAPLAPEASYRLHYALWLESQIHLAASSDIEISIDQLSQDKDYRAETLATLEAAGISGLDFSDCRISTSSFSTEELAFFERMERGVEEQVGLAGNAVGAGLLKAIIERKHTGNFKSPRRSAQVEKLAGDAARARQVALNAENYASVQRESALRAGGGMMAMHAAIIGVQTTMQQEFEARLHEQAVEIGRLHHACADRDTALNHTRKSYEDTLAHTRSEATRAQNKMSRLITEMRTARENWAERADKYERALAHFHQQVARNEGEIIKLRQEIADEHTRRVQANETMIALRQHIHGLEKSTSWKLTAPLRWLSKLLSIRLWLSTGKNIARRVLTASLLAIRKVPGGPNALRKVTALVPPLHRKLEHFASVRSIGGGVVAEAAEAAPVLSSHAIGGGPLDPALVAGLQHYVQTTYGTEALVQHKDQLK